METHVKVLAVLYLVFSSLFALGALLLVLTFGGASALVGTTAAPEDAAIALPIIGLTGMALFIFLVALAVPGFLAGYGLLTYAGWGRILAIVLSALHVLNVPFGTVFGAYGLWVLLQRDTERLFESKAASDRP